jgi:hypothetical protein
MAGSEQRELGRTDTSHTDTVRYGTVDRDYGLRLATCDPAEDGPIWMVNLMKYRAVADYADSASDSEPISGLAADDRYAPVGVLAEIGAEVAFLGTVEHQFLNPEPLWDRVGVVRYPTRRSFIDMQRRDDFKQQHAHKDAGMEQTIVMGALPIPFPRVAPDQIRPWDEVPNPPSAHDGPVMVTHVVSYETTEDNGPDPAMVTPAEMRAYSQAATAVAVQQGVRIAGWFGVEGTIVGDGRIWHQVRFNAFPSLAAFMVVATDPARLEAQKRHRERAIADTYTLVTRPSINRFETLLD